MRIDDTLASTVRELTRPGRGTLAADESQPTITKCFGAAGGCG